MRLSDPESVNIAAALVTMAQDRPEALAIACPVGVGRQRYVRWTYRELNELSDAIAAALETLGIGRGVRTVLMVKPGHEFFALTFALFKTGAVPVLIDPGMGVKNLGRCLAEAEPEAYIGIARAQVARLLLGWGRKTIRCVVTIHPSTLRRLHAVGVPRLAGRPFPIARTCPDEPAAILFTSGSTGPPKGAVYTHANFAAQVEIFKNLYDIGAGEIDLCTFPLFALFAPALGMSAIVPEMDATRPARVDPRKIIRAIEQFGVTNMFGSPALIRRVGAFGSEHSRKLPTLRRVISAGAPVPASVLETFASMLGPDRQIFTPYGATEALPVCSIGSAEILNETRERTNQGGGVCVGRPVPGIRVEVIRITDEPIAGWSVDLRVADGAIGELAVQGPVVTSSYFQRPEATAQAKIDDPTTGGFWHRMGDLGYRDDQGRIWFCGRKSQRVRTDSGTLYTIPCESIFNVHPDVARSALVEVAGRPVLCVETRRRLNLSEFERLCTELRALAQQHPQTEPIETFLHHRAFPVDIRHNSKIFREQLATWAARRLR